MEGVGGRSTHLCLLVLLLSARVSYVCVGNISQRSRSHSPVYNLSRPDSRAQFLVRVRVGNKSFVSSSVMKRGMEEGSRRERRNEMPGGGGGGPHTGRPSRPAENRPKGRREGFLIWSFSFLPRLEEEERGR